LRSVFPPADGISGQVGREAIKPIEDGRITLSATPEQVVLRCQLG
jgi:hypothetical protein